MKKLFIYAQLLLIVFTISNAEVENPVSPRNKAIPSMAIVSGLDGVLITKNWWIITKKLTRLFLEAHNRFELTKLLLMPQFWKDCYKAFYHKTYINGVRLRHTNHNIEYLACKYPAIRPHQEKIIDIFYEPKIKTEMVQLFCFFKITTEYPLFLATSKNKRSLKRVKLLLNPMLKKEREMSWKEFFNGVFTEEKSTEGHRPNKTSIEYYHALWKYLINKKSLSADTLLIFIDENPRHIQMARRASRQFDIPLKAIQYKGIEQIQDALYKILKEERVRK